MNNRLSEGYEPRFDIDAEVGYQGQLFVHNITDALKAGSIEVKTDERALSTGRVYIEIECQTRTGWRPSGISSTLAELWAQVLPGSVVIVETRLLRRVAEHAYLDHPELRVDCRRGSHPTRGVAIPLGVLLTWLADTTDT
jgi:hypothetical protein